MHPLSPERIALRHNAFVYSSQHEYVERSVAFLRDGLAAGEGAIVANTRSRLAVMREALDGDAGAVTFVDVGAAYTRPARTLAAYHDVYARELRRAGSVRAVADVQFGPDPGEWDVWTGYEAVFNRSFAHLPVWVLCSYDADGIPDPVLEGVWRTHPQVLAGDAWSTGEHYEEPEGVVRSVLREPERLEGLRRVALGAGTVEEVRERVARELAAERVDEQRAIDMLLAVTEVAANAIEHGDGIAALRVGRSEGRFVCEIDDRGPGFDDPLAGYLAPRAGVGAGLWVVRQTAWHLEFLRAAEGFTARIWL
jgi:anti-sigma regulatory factor (Ser/Thr protein kinase)